MRFRRLMLALFAAPLVLSFGCGDSKPFSYKLRPKAGISYKAEDEFSVNMRINTPSFSKRGAFQIKGKSRFQFKNEKDGTLVTYLGGGSSSSSASSGGSSSSAAPDRLDAINFRRLDIRLRRVTPMGLAFKADESGNIIQPPPIRSMVEANLAKLPPLPESERLAISVELFLNFSARTYQASQRLLPIPAGDRRVDDVWDVQLEPMPGIQAAVECALKERSRGKALIEAYGPLRAGDPVPMMFAGAFPFDAQYRNMRGSYRAAYTIDESTGLPIKYKARTEIQANLETRLEDGKIASVPLLMEIEMKGKLSE